MKIFNSNSFLCFLAISILQLSSSCNRECTGEDTIVENKLPLEIMSIYRYDSFDTISCVINNQPSITIQSEEKVESFEIHKNFQNYDCGIGILNHNHFRDVNYFDNANKLILSTYIVNNENDFLIIDFDFYNSNIYEDYSIGFSRFWPTDTSTIDGHFYSDIYSEFDTSTNYALYYSKSKGLIKIISNGKTIFQLIQ